MDLDLQGDATMALTREEFEASTGDVVLAGKELLDALLQIDDLLSAGTRRRPLQPPASAELAAPISAPVPRPEPSALVAAPVEPESPGICRGTFQLTVENDLHQLSYHTPWSRGDKSYIVNKALEEYLAKYPKSREVIPEEDAVRRRDRRYH